MLIQRMSDKEILAITKYQLLWAELEEQPDEKTALKYMSRQQLAIALAYVCGMRGNVMRDVSQVQNKRKQNKLRYDKIKAEADFQPAESRQTADIQQEQIRLDKIRVYNKGNYSSIEDSHNYRDNSTVVENKILEVVPRGGNILEVKDDSLARAYSPPNFGKGNVIDFPKKVPIAHSDF